MSQNPMSLKHDHMMIVRWFNHLTIRLSRSINFTAEEGDYAIHIKNKQKKTARKSTILNS